MCVRRSTYRRECGVTLIEQILFIVIVGAAVAGVMGAVSFATRASADPMIQKQALAIAEAVLEEVQLQPFTYCDPDDPAAAAANSVAGCATPEGIGAEGETRGGATPFDNVSDYNGFAAASPPGFTAIDGTAIPGLEGYAVTVGVAGQPLGGIGNDTGGRPQSLLITVTVTAPGSVSVALNGYRTRYAPNALP